MPGIAWFDACIAFASCSTLLTSLFRQNQNVSRDVSSSVTNVISSPRDQNMTDQSKTSSESDDHTYDISTVCRLTGLTSANLRVWEKRYQAVNPSRSSSGRRQYSRRDLQRITLLKTLTDLGHSISSSAKLPIAELERRIEESARPDLAPPGDSVGSSITRHSCRIGVVGTFIGTVLENAEIRPDRATKVVEYADLEAAEQADHSLDMDLLIVECPALFQEEITRIEHLIAQTKSLRAIVIYAYTQKDVLDLLEGKGNQITAIRSPISPRELRVLCEADIAMANRSASAVLANAPLPGEAVDGIPERIFSEDQLAAITNLTSSVKCECPQQMVALLKSLNGFELYSLECESRNAADAEIHAYLHKSTAQARSVVENALKVLLEFEDLSPDETAKP